MVAGAERLPAASAGAALQEACTDAAVCLLVKNAHTFFRFAF